MADPTPETFTVRVLSPDGQRSGGLGALVGPQHVITCAHVVNAALDLDLRAQGKPSKAVRIVFPFLPDARGKTVSATVQIWRPPSKPGAAGDDIAGLFIEGSLPDDAILGRLAADPPRPGSAVRVFGYPADPPRPAGSLVAAVVRGSVPGGRLQLDSDSSSALHVQRGFSGSPVFDDSIGRIVGLVAQAAAGGSASDSYAVGTSLLHDVWPEVLGARPTGSPRPRAELTILHVSGPRFSSADTMPQEALFGQLHRDITEIGNRHGLHPDLLIVTGDLADAGLPGEYRQATEFLGALAGSAGIPRRNVAIVPGGHDVNQLACAAHFLTQESLQQQPIPPFFPKWSPFVAAFEEFYADIDGVAFTPDEPWALFEMPDLGVVVAGMNSTIASTHRDEDRFGQVGTAP